MKVDWYVINWNEKVKVLGEVVNQDEWDTKYM